MDQASKFCSHVAKTAKGGSLESTIERFKDDLYTMVLIEGTKCFAIPEDATALIAVFKDDSIVMSMEDDSTPTMWRTIPPPQTDVEKTLLSALVMTSSALMEYMHETEE